MKLHDDGELTDIEFKEQISILPNGRAPLPLRTRPFAGRKRIMLWSLGIVGPMSGAAIGALSAKTAIDFLAGMIVMTIVVWDGAFAIWLPLRAVRWISITVAYLSGYVCVVRQLDGRVASMTMR